MNAAEVIAAADGTFLRGEDAVDYALQANYVHGKSGADTAGFAGTELLTRAEAIQIIKNMIIVKTANPE